MRIEDDEKYMRHAIGLARKGIGHVNPNPLVGAVLVKDGRIIGEGYHEIFGGPHAEVNAFSNCSENTSGATLYVTLEPCSHHGKTPPCVDFVIEKKLKRVVIAMEDPNPLVAGKSIRKLKDAGIFVTTGVLQKEAKKLNEVFVKYITQKKPFILYKCGASLDGKIACHTGESQWITSQDSRNEVQYLRTFYTAIMVGANTIKKDNPRLTSRIKDGRNPIRIIIDGKLSAPLDSNVFHEEGRTLVITTESSDIGKREALQTLGVEVILSESEEKGKIDLCSLLSILGLMGIDGILLEGGATLAEEALRAGIIDKIRFYMAPMLIGGSHSPGMFGGKGISRLVSAYRVKDMVTERCGPDLVMEGTLVYPKEEASKNKKMEREILKRGDGLCLPVS